MAGLLSLVSSRMAPAFDAVQPGADPVVRPSDRADFQANGALPLARRGGAGNPRAVAEEIVGRLDTSGWCAKAEVAGPGFINLTLDDGWLAELVAAQAGDDRLGADRRSVSRLVVVDYGSPNVAKEMHVGHLR
ncbi:MAG TPA: arginine--tRNA ligase, partial [Acidimicrobiales bacterium]|nr:arginine--tRNA ligase [Acidimicrobiales bacterium]